MVELAIDEGRTNLPTLTYDELFEKKFRDDSLNDVGVVSTVPPQSQTSTKMRLVPLGVVFGVQVGELTAMACFDLILAWSNETA